ncbi:unnamed protein product, partial [Effrenium voratum]
RLGAKKNEKLRLLPEHFAAKVRLGAAVGVDCATLRGAAAGACERLADKVLLPKLGSAVVRSETQLSITCEGRSFSLPEEDCWLLPAAKVSCECLCNVIWEQLREA